MEYLRPLSTPTLLNEGQGGQAYSSTDRRKDWTGAIAFPFSSHVGFLEAQAILRAPFKP
jgi:hypothetical protein